MDIDNLLKRVDHTLLKQNATESEILKIVEEAAEFNVASCCIPPCFVKSASTFAKGKVKICTVIGFPNGYNTTETKMFEMKRAIEDGADELDLVINVGALKSKNFDYVLNELTEARKVCGGKTLKIIIEACLLSKQEKIEMCDMVTMARADYIKTSTGFSTGGATLDDVRLFREYLGEDIKIKAAGGIRTLEDAEKFIEAGADRIGASALIALAKSNK